MGCGPLVIGIAIIRTGVAMEVGRGIVVVEGRIAGGEGAKGVGHC
jgi:DUF1009 family protein